MCANLAEAIFTIGAEDLAEVIVRKLAAESETIALAESCTGGFLAHRIT
ncbi:MAG: competence protein ComA, partial [Chthoniobacterales bacterium]